MKCRQSGEGSRWSLPLPFLLPWVAALAAHSSPAVAATRVVDHSGGTPYSTIQSAIDVSLAGDVVLVHCGVYPENVLMKDGVSVNGAGAACTVIDGGAAGSVVTMVGTGPATALSGFTIRNGLSDLGGGIYIEAGSPTITANVITQNS